MTDASPPLSALVDPALLARWARSRDSVERAVAYLGAPLGHHLLKDHIDDPSGREVLRTAATFRAIENRKHLERGADLCANLEASGISCVPIKGLANALSHWPQPELRSFLDVDLLIREEDLELVIEWFCDHKFRFVIDPLVRGETVAERMHHLARLLLVRRGGELVSIIAPDGGVVVDLHTHVESNPVPNVLHTDEVLAASIPRTTSSGEIRLPAPHHAFIIAVLHAHRSRYHAGEIKTLVDAMLLLRRFPDEIAAAVPRLACEGGMSRRVGFFLELIRSLSPTTDVPAGLPDSSGTVDGHILREAIGEVTLASVQKRSTVARMRQKVRQDFLLSDSWSDYGRLYLGRFGEPWHRRWEEVLAARPR